MEIFPMSGIYYEFLLEIIILVLEQMVLRRANMLQESGMVNMKRITFLTMVGSVLMMGQIACEKPPTHREVRNTKRVDAQIAALKSDSHDANIKAAEKLANMSERAIGAVDALIAALGDENAELRAYAALALGKICRPPADLTSPAHDAAVQALRKSLKDTDGLVRVWSALALFRIEPEAPPEIETIGEVVANKGNTDVRIQAAVAIVQIGPRAKEAVGALITALSSPGVRRHAAYALGAIGPDAKEAIGALTRVSGGSGAAGDAAKTAIEQIRK
jgi:HEAT repeat protein